ncbi:MAG: carotenoid biosynthesis protein [Gemmatimonadaceae bacterium]|nr:carotenoid biosynthesis protein [Gemmatimonadaceae bacterium]
MSRTTKLAWGFFSLHVVFTLFGSLAWATLLSGPPPLWLQQEPNATINRLAWAYLGPGTVVFGALAAILHASERFGRRTAWTMFAVASTVALSSELLGTSTGYPFGPYEYTTLLGYRILGLVPFPIPISWYYMLYGSLAILARTLRPSDSSASKWGWAALAGVILTAWDVSMDPAMVNTAHWVWHTAGAYYGMPWSNFAGWLLTGTIVARVMLAFVPPSQWTREVAPTRMPFGIYAINGVMPITICFARGMFWAGVLGTLAMAIPLGLAWRGRRDSL